MKGCSNLLWLISFFLLVTVQNFVLVSIGNSVIRDTEIEGIIKRISAPIIDAAGMFPDSVRLYLINKDEINAFVAGGQKIFLTTGLIRSTQNPNQLLGVIAHEIGHISAGHLIRLRRELTKSNNTAMASQMFGLALSLLSGNPGFMAAAGSGGAHIAQRSLLKFSRTQEQSADQAALRYMEKAGFSSKGMLEFLQILEGQDLLSESTQDPYIQTHPLTSDRISFVKEHVKNSKYTDLRLPDKIKAQHARMIAKLDAFLDAPHKVLKKYSAKPNSPIKRYSLAIAHYRDANLKKAIAEINTLISDFPKDPFYRELKGQILFENSKINQALLAYQKAVAMLPSAPLLRVSLAHAMLESNENNVVTKARIHLRYAILKDRRIPLAWRLLATANGRLGHLGLSALASAEYNLLINRKRDAIKQAKRAIKILQAGEPAWLRSHDIIAKISPE